MASQPIRSSATSAMIRAAPTASLAELSRCPRADSADARPSARLRSVTSTASPTQPETLPVLSRSGSTRASNTRPATSIR